MYLHAGESRELLGRVDDKLTLVLYRAAHIVRQTASGVGYVLALGDQYDLRVAVLTLELGGGLCSGGNSANDQQFHGSFPLS